MTAAAQSSPEDIDSWTRVYAEEQARLSGVSVREWIEQFVAQTAAGAETAAPEADAEPTRESWDLEGVAEQQPEIAAAREEPDWVSRASAAFAIVEAQTIEDAPETPTETIAGPPAADEPRDDEIERVLDELAAQVDTVRAQMTAKLREESSRRLDGIERALRGMREQIQAAEQGVATSGELDSDIPSPPPHFGGAVEARALETQRMVELVDSGFERLEASSARQMAGLRADIEQLFDALTARLDNIEQRAAPIAAITAQPLLAADLDIKPEPEPEPEPVPAMVEEPQFVPAAAAAAPHPEPSAFDSDLFDDFPEPAAPTLRDLLKDDTVAAVHSAQLEAPASPFANEHAGFAAHAGADDDLVDSDDEWAAAGSAPLAWPDASRASAAPAFGADARDNPVELPLTIRAPEQSAGQGQDPASGAGKPSIFSLFGRGQSRLRKSA